MTTSNLLTGIYRAAHEQGGRRGIRFLGFGGQDVEVSYEKFLRMGAWLGERLPVDGDADGRRTLVIAANHPLPALLAFFAGLTTNVQPLMLPGPRALGGPDPFLERVRQILARFSGRCVLGLETGLVPDGTSWHGVPVVPLPSDITSYGLAAEGSAAAGYTADGDDVAFLQMTSASTGDGKLVAISHANACANLEALCVALDAGADSRMGTWLPHYHDMGLVGTVLLSFMNGWPLYMMKPTDFIMRPYRWIDMLSRFRCTITAAPNFGFDYARRMVTEEQIEGCDLSALERAVIGAEPISMATLQGFYERFRGYGLRADSLVCSYGMAESTLGTTMVRPRSLPRHVFVDVADTSYGKPVRILGEGFVGDRATSPANHHGVAVFSVGPALDGIEVTLTDEDGEALEGDGVLGEIALRGASICVGYLDYESGHPVPLTDGRLRTGDLGFFRGGDLYILDRKKHVIIRHGQNYLASLMEDGVAGVLGRPSHDLIVVDADIYDPASEISVIVENFAGTDELRPDQVAALRELDLPVDTLLFSRKRVIPRTTSGKKKYDQMRRRLSDGTLPISHSVRLVPGA